MVNDMIKNDEFDNIQIRIKYKPEIYISRSIKEKGTSMYKTSTIKNIDNYQDHSFTIDFKIDKETNKVELLFEKNIIVQLDKVRLFMQHDILSLLRSIELFGENKHIKEIIEMIENEGDINE